MTPHKKGGGSSNVQDAEAQASRSRLERQADRHETMMLILTVLLFGRLIRDREFVLSVGLLVAWILLMVVGPYRGRRR